MFDLRTLSNLFFTNRHFTEVLISDLGWIQLLKGLETIAMDSYLRNVLVPSIRGRVDGTGGRAFEFCSIGPWFISLGCFLLLSRIIQLSNF